MHPRCYLSLVTSFICMVPTIVYSATYYVAKTGSNSYSCTQAQSASTPKLTIAGGLACLIGGDTLVIGTGTYTESIRNIPGGSSAARTKIMGNNGAQWTVRPDGVGCATNRVVYLHNISWVEVSDFTIDAANCGHGLTFEESSSDNYIHHGEIKNSGRSGGNGQGLGFDAGPSPLAHRNRISYMYIHDSGLDSLDHCIYVTGSDHIIEYNRYENCSGHGIHVYNGTPGSNNRNVIRWNAVRNNGSWGIGIYSGNENQVYGNVVTGNGASIVSGGIRIGTIYNGTKADRTRVYNNTIYANLNSGACIWVASASENDTVVRNNACVNNANNIIVNSGTRTVQSNNHMTTDKTVFVDAAARNFSPRAGSVLIDAGTSIGLPIGVGFVGAAPDQGAVEFTSLVTTPPPQIVNTPTELQVAP